MQGEANKNTGKVFRPEIEGLRAVAALLVAVFHIWLGRVSGGVDVFFVVSSFLVTTGLINQLERNGRIDFARSWARLVKRLVPAAFLVLLIVIVAALFVLPKTHWKETIIQVAASAVYMENWRLAYDAVDYLAQSAAVSPVQHFWALSVQGQFYFFWPLLLTAIYSVARNKGIALRKAMLTALAIVFAVSLTYSIVLTRLNQPLAYFNTLARVFEFCIGAMLAGVIPQLVLSKHWRVMLGWLGLCAILSCGFALNVSTVFPGYAALWPTSAAVLVIAAGTSSSRFGVDRILASKPMVYVGGISYSIYLWHFPILIFCRNYAHPAKMSFDAKAGVLIVAIILAVLTNRFIENPIRRSKLGAHKPSHAFALSAACAVPLILGLLVWGRLYLVERDRDRIAYRAEEYPGALAMRSRDGAFYKTTARVYPGPLAVEYDRPFPTGDGCDLPYESTAPIPCKLGAVSSNRIIAVAGSSHAAQWLPALDMIGRQAGYRMLSFTKSNCAFHDGDDGVTEREVGFCPEWNRNVLNEILRIHPYAVLTVATRHVNGRELIPDTYLAMWRKLSKAGIRVIALRNNPDLGFDVSECVEIHGAESPACIRSRQLAQGDLASLADAGSLPSNVRLIDLSDFFCDQQFCYPVIGNVMVYRHGAHITATYARSMIPILQPALMSAMESSDMAAEALAGMAKPASMNGPALKR